VNATRFHKKTGKVPVLLKREVLVILLTDTAALLREAIDLVDKDSERRMDKAFAG
jgi:hypothetical protein